MRTKNIFNQISESRGLISHEISANKLIETDCSTWSLWETIKQHICYDMKVETALAASFRCKAFWNLWGLGDTSEHSYPKIPVKAHLYSSLFVECLSV